jgi:tellurite resistance protein
MRIEKGRKRKTEKKGGNWLSRQETRRMTVLVNVSVLVARASSRSSSRRARGCVRNYSKKQSNESEEDESEQEIEMRTDRGAKKAKRRRGEEAKETRGQISERVTLGQAKGRGMGVCHDGSCRSRREGAKI